MLVSVFLKEGMCQVDQTRVAEVQRETSFKKDNIVYDREVILLGDYMKIFINIFFYDSCVYKVVIWEQRGC